jgi:polyisoprenoid-binding protein YceI
MKRTIVRVAIALVAVIAIIYGGILLWTKVINKPEEKLGAGDLSAVVNDSVAPTDSTSPSDDGDVSGTWVATGDSTLGYRVQEILGGVDTEGVGRTNDVTGSITIEGTTLTAAEFTVNMASITSDSERRDSQFNTRIMDTATFPTATFVLTAPIELGSVPIPGTQITVTATGDLTLRGTTLPVTFEITAEYSGTSIGVFGSIPVLFADYGIPNPSNAFVSTRDNGLLEFVLAFAR